MAGTFNNIERTVGGHFRLNFYAAVYALVHAVHRLAGGRGRALEGTLQKHRFLAGYLGQILPLIPGHLNWEEMLTWWHEEIVAWERDVCVPLPLRALAAAGYLPFRGRLALLVAALAEEDERFGTLFEDLQNPAGARRPCLALLGHIVNGDSQLGEIEAGTLCRRLLSAGLLDVVNPDAPRSEWILKVPAAIWSVIRGERIDEHLPGCRFVAAAAAEPLDQLVLDEELRTRLHRLPPLLSTGSIRALVVRGSPGSDQLQVVGSVARALGLGVAVLEGAVRKTAEAAAEQRTLWPLLGPLCVMGQYLPVFSFDLAPGETAEVAVIPEYQGPIAIVLGPEGGVAHAAADGALTVNLPQPTALQRQHHWRRALGPRSPADLEALSERFVLPPGHIRQVASMASGYALLEQRAAIEVSDVRRACRELNRQLLETHAAHLDGHGTWNDLIVSDATAVRLHDLERRCRQRERLLAHLSPAYGSGANRGVRALLTGASGTGKTLAAKILAAELGMDLYRVDLGAVVNKYIGETEKNLHRVLSRAEALDVVLLLDEGDSLLANRTEVKSANDRYANLETNYLLQRLETYQGIVLVTTNAPQLIDRAFQRRMDVVVPFVQPHAEERRAIWRLHLPANHALPGEFLADLVRRCALTGGQIRNAALHATLLAVDEGADGVRRPHVEAAVHSEYRKAGATCPLAIDGSAPARRGVGAFLESMRS